MTFEDNESQLRVGLLLEVLVYQANPTELHVLMNGQVYKEVFIEWSAVKEIKGELQFPLKHAPNLQDLPAKEVGDTAIAHALKKARNGR